MRFAITCVLLSACGASCTTPDPGAAFADALRQAPTGTRAELDWSAGHVTRHMAPLPDSAIPEAARRTADRFIQPDGTSVFRGREWNPRTSGYRFVKSYAQDGAPDGARRSVLVSATGDVLERSHEIPAADCPAPAREAAAALGTIRRVAVVQYEQTEHFRFTLDFQGERRSATIDAAGNVLASTRTVNAAINVDLPR